MTWPSSQQFSEARLASAREKEATASKKIRNRKDDGATHDDQEADVRDDEQVRHDANGRHNLRRNDYYASVDDAGSNMAQPGNSLKHKSYE